MKLDVPGRVLLQRDFMENLIGQDSQCLLQPLDMLLRGWSCYFCSDGKCTRQQEQRAWKRPAGHGNPLSPTSKRAPVHRHGLGHTIKRVQALCIQKERSIEHNAVQVCMLPKSYIVYNALQRKASPVEGQVKPLAKLPAHEWHSILAIRGTDAPCPAS